MYLPHQKIINKLNAKAGIYVAGLPDTKDYNGDTGAKVCKSGKTKSCKQKQRVPKEPKAGTKLFFVGGIVRDLILGVPIKDIDIVVEGDAVDFCKTLAGDPTASSSLSAGESFAFSTDTAILSTHKDFGTCKMKMDGVEIDFASTREEIYPKSGCLPIVKNIGCPLKKDVLRRDFTVNSIAIDLQTGEIVDYLGGVEDLKNKELKITYPESFYDDPTRILRALDFHLRFNFSLPLKEIEKFFINPPNKEGLSISRVDLTLKKILIHPKAYEKILEMKLYKIFQDEAPQIPPNELEDAILFFGADPVISRFRALKNDLPIIVKAKSNYEIYKACKNLSKEDLALLNTPEAKKYYKKLNHIKVGLSGTDILKMGVKEGKIIGVLLEKLLEMKLNNPQNAPKNKQEEVDFVLKMLKK